MYNEEPQLMMVNYCNIATIAEKISYFVIFRNNTKSSCNILLRETLHIYYADLTSWLHEAWVTSSGLGQNLKFLQNLLPG